MAEVQKKAEWSKLVNNNPQSRSRSGSEFLLRRAADRNQEMEEEPRGGEGGVKKGRGKNKSQTSQKIVVLEQPHLEGKDC